MTYAVTAACWARFVLGLALLVAVVFAQAAPVVELDAGRQPQRLLAGGEWWLDTTGAAAVEQLAADAAVAWQPLRENTIHPLARGKALWVRFTLRTEANPAGERWYLEVPYAAVDRVTLFSLDNAGRWTAATAGDLLAVADWPVPHRHPLLPLATRSGGTRTWYVRVENSHHYSAPLQFVTESYQSIGEQRSSLLLGMYFGLASLACVLAVLSAITLRDRAFACFALSIAFTGLAQAATTGIAGLHVWPHWPAWNDLAPFVLPVLAGGSMAIFIDAVVSLRERSPRLHVVVASLAVLSIFLCVAIVLADPSTRVQLMLPYVVLLIPILLGILLWSLQRGDRHAGWVLAGLLPVAIGALFPVARTAGLIPVSFWTRHSLQLGLAIELPILLAVLLQRSQQRRDNARRLQLVDRIDPATGLLNAAVFHERLVRLIARSVRLKYRSAILLVDITNLDQIRRDFDRAAAQELPVRVAGRLLSAAREIDSVARLSEHRFGLLLEGPLKADEVAEAAPRVVTRCLMPFKNRPPGWVPRVRVAQALIPKDGTDPQQLMEQLEQLLESASPDSRSAVFMASTPNLPTPMPLTP